LALKQENVTQDRNNTKERYKGMVSEICPDLDGLHPCLKGVGSLPLAQETVDQALVVEVLNVVGRQMQCDMLQADWLRVT